MSSSMSAPVRSPHRGHTSEAARRWPALLVLCSAQLMVILDGSIVSVALPAVQTDLGFSSAGLAWVVNAYLITFGGLLLLGGRLGDVLGNRRVLIGGLTLFAVASASCALAVTPGMLVVSRFLQGAGGAFAAAVALGMVVGLYPEQPGQGKALGVFGFVGAAGSSIGLVAGGALTESFGWHWVFLVNVPLAVGALAGTWRFVPPSAGRGGGADLPGALLVTAGLMTSIYVLVTAGDVGRRPAVSAALGLVAVILMVGFVVRQATAAAPLLPLRLLSRRPVAVGNVIQALMVAGLFGFQFLGVLYLQRVLTYGPMRTGLAFLPVAATIAVVSLTLTAPLVSRIGLKAVLIGGLTLITAGLFLLARVPLAGRYAVDVLPPALLLAVGFGLAFPALAVLAVSRAPRADAGVASGLFNTAQQVGGAVGLAVLVSLAAYRSRILPLPNSRPSLLSGYHWAFAVAAAFSALALCVALVGGIGAGRATARSDAPDVDTAPD